jgi:hypothetical protein
VSATIEATRASEGDPLIFDVRVREGKSETRHRVTLSQKSRLRLGKDATAERIVEAAFRFLLDREPKEAILASFDVDLIESYFPEFEARLPDYLGPE